MPKPPMNDTITIFRPLLDGSGKPINDDYDRPRMKSFQSKARVTYTTKLNEKADEQEIDQVLNIDLPPETAASKGWRVEWVDRFGVTINDVITGVDEVLSFSGKKVYFRTIYVG